MPTAITDDNEAWHPTVTVDGPQIFVSVVINGFKIAIAKRNLDHFDAQDPYFFDSDYTIAGSTGFLLWEANWLVLRLLRPVPAPGREPHTRSISPPLRTDSLLHHHQTSCNLRRLLTGRRVLDLGSGTGLAGLCAAACGAHVLLTDLASVCEGALRANVQRNALPAIAPEPAMTAPATEAEAVMNSPALGSSRGPHNTSPGDKPPDAAEEAHGIEVEEAAEEEEGEGEGEGEVCGLEVGHGVSPWGGAVKVGRGSAAVMALDWTEPLEPQVRAGGNDPRDADFILAVDTIWLLDIFHAFVGIVLAVLSHGIAPNAAAAAVASLPPSPSSGSDSGRDPARGRDPAQRHGRRRHHHQRACFLAFVERAGEDSKLFIRKEAVVSELQARGCNVEVIVAENVDVDGVMRPGRVLRVTLAASSS